MLALKNVITLNIFCVLDKGSYFYETFFSIAYSDSYTTEFPILFNRHVNFFSIHPKKASIGQIDTSETPGVCHVCFLATEFTWLEEAMAHKSALVIVPKQLDSDVTIVQEWN